MKIKAVLLTLSLILSISTVYAETTLNWWQFWTDPGIKPTINAMVEDFEKANPDIKVKVTDLTWANGHEKLVMAFASGTAPDVVELGSDWLGEFIVNDHIADITYHITADSGEFDGWSMATYDDKVYARPWILGTRVIFGNRDLLTRAGFKEDTIPTIFMAFRRMTNKISSLGSDIYGWGSNAPEKHRLYKKFLPFFWSAGAQIFTDDNKYCVFSSMNAGNAMNLYQILNDSSGYVASQRGIEDAFLDGKIGFILSGDWLLKRIKQENRKINFFTALFPGPVLPGRSFMGGEFLAVNKNIDKDKKEAALKFIDFMTSPENQLRFCKANYSANPSSRKAQEDDYFKQDVNLQTFIKQLRMAKHPPVDPNWVYIEEIIEKAVEDVVFNGQPIAATLLEAQHKIAALRKK
ncbi:MAG: extracellular solute-binding protein [candidate division Zixibacteria bacterium]|nr:extracellular solute-binding protein [candidate division Zixibacteria bacterium]